MFPIANLNSEIKEVVGLDKIYDFYRLVDINTHEVLDLPEGGADFVRTGAKCHHIWGRQGACPNCTSLSCVLQQKTIVKIMHLQNQYLLITSVPVKLRGQDYALELIKDITDTFMLPDVAGYDNIRVIELVERFNNLAVHDTFTALYNKTYVMTQLHEMLMRCKELGEQPSADVVMLDLDLFKDVNDEHGHVVGDDVLLSFALQLKHIAHGWKDGWAARYGGDEFILCAPHGMGDDGMHQIAEGIASFESDVSQHVEGAPRVSVSYGVARMRLDDTAKSLIDRADDEMYVMKARHHAELGVSDR